MTLIRKKDAIKKLFIIFVFIFPIYFPLKILVEGSFPHWHDTAWGLLLGLENLQKIRLIGYEGGIPGIFYGPHWSWMVALVQIFNKDPAVIAFFVLVLPYFILIPFLLYKFKPLFGQTTVVILWLLFILAYYTNTVHLWHVGLAPLIFLGIFSCIISINWDKGLSKNLINILILGFLSGLLIQLHMSFGAAIFLAVLAYLFLNILLLFKNKRVLRLFFKNIIYGLIPFLTGAAIASAPFILFELRHGFGQTKRIIYVLTQSFIYNSAVVGQWGLTGVQIMDEFFSLPKKLLQLPNQISPLWFFIIFILIFYSIVNRKIKLGQKEIQLVLFTLISTLVMLFVFISSKNPIWGYQFIGAEIIFLMLFGVLLAKFSKLRLLFIIWIVILALSMFYKTLKPDNIDPLTVQTLSTKKYIVNSLYTDAGDKPFSVFVYAPSIYTFDYDYLFKWLGNDKYGYEPQQNQDIVYLIIPDNNWVIREDFINYKTPQDRFVTIKDWEIGGQTLVVKRQRINPAN